MYFRFFGIYVNWIGSIRIGGKRQRENKKKPPITEKKSMQSPAIGYMVLKNECAKYILIVFLNCIDRSKKWRIIKIDIQLDY